MAAKPLILIVDDSMDFREIVGLKLAASGFEVVEAQDGKDALEKLKTIRPALVLLDMQMPLMDGAETLANIKSNPALKDLKVVFLTNLGEARHAEGWTDEKFAREAGALDYIKKTSDLNDIVTEVKRLCGSPPSSSS